MEGSVLTTREWLRAPEAPGPDPAMIEAARGIWREAALSAEKEQKS